MIMGIDVGQILTIMSPAAIIIGAVMAGLGRLWHLFQRELDNSQAECNKRLDRIEQAFTAMGGRVSAVELANARIEGMIANKGS